jgi:Polyketide cyclase / dehydrase and lipid transport
MNRMMAAALLALVAPAYAAEPIAAQRHRAPDGSYSLVHEAIVDAPVAEVWTAISTAEGWKSWAVPVAWAPAPDLIETSYAEAAVPGDATTIRQQVLLRLPARLMVFRTVKGPAGFADFDTFAKVTSAFELEPAGEGKTRVRLTGAGYADTDTGRRLLGFFERGNSESLQALRAHFVGHGAAAVRRLREELEPLRFLVGHCWRGEFPSTGEQDTHCFERAFEGQHIRDRHEVTGGSKIYRGETLYSWNAAQRRVEYTYWNSVGGVSRGTMAPAPDGLDFGNESYTGPDGKKMTISTFWRKVDDGAYEAVTRSSTGATPDRVVRYRRVG